MSDTTKAAEDEKRIKGDIDAVAAVTAEKNVQNNDGDHQQEPPHQQSRLLRSCAVTSSIEVARTRWVALHTLQWTDPYGVARGWDCASRTTKTSPAAVDGVIIIPLLQDPTDPSRPPVETLLVEQYRPPVRSVTLEFPAGLVDANETIEQAALRELREETGYVGEACRTLPIASPSLCMSPGLCDELVQVVLVDVDLSNPYNHGTPTPQLDAGEFCTVRRVTLQQGMQEILASSSSTSAASTTTRPMPIMGLYLFALGWELGQQQQQRQRPISSPPPLPQQDQHQQQVSEESK